MSNRETKSAICRLKYPVERRKMIPFEFDVRRCQADIFQSILMCDVRNRIKIKANILCKEITTDFLADYRFIVCSFIPFIHYSIDCCYSIRKLT